MSQISPETAALEQIAIVCTDNMDRDCDHRMALDFVRQIANDCLSREHAQQAKEPISFMAAMDIVEAGFNNWKGKAHNAKWWRRIDGTPIPNDLMVNIAEAISRSTLSDTSTAGNSK